MASTGADVVLVTETPPGVENGNTNLAADNEGGLVRAVLAETTSSPTHTDNRFRYAYYRLVVWTFFWQSQVSGFAGILRFFGNFP